MKKVQKTMLLTVLCLCCLLNLKAEMSIHANERKIPAAEQASLLYYRVFRATGELAGIVKVTDPAQLTQQVKRFGKGTYICVGIGNAAIADRRIIVY